MKSLIFVFVVFSISLLRSQHINVQFSFTDGTDTTHNLMVGADPTATSGLDPHLGEDLRPPIPPYVFDAWFEIAGTNITTYRDYRNAPQIPFTGVHIHRLQWQHGNFPYEDKVNYNLPPAIRMLIKDPSGGTLFSSDTLSGSGSYTIPDSLNYWNFVLLYMIYENAGGDPWGPLFDIIPSFLPFPQRIIGTVDSLPVTVYNQGSTNTLTIAGTGSSSNYFSISHGPLPIIIPPLSSRTFYIVNTSPPNNISGSIYFSHNGSGSGLLYVFAPAGLPTPVELVSFTAFLYDHYVKLNWLTAVEINNKGFEIERGREPLDDNSWKKIGFIKGGGTTSEYRNYSFTDDQILSDEVNFYRLKQIDFNGTFTYSDEIKISVNFPQRFLLEQNYPNPFNNSTIIKYSISEKGLTTLKIYNMLGEEIKTILSGNKEPGDYEITFDAADLSGAIYLYRLHSGNYVESKKMILLK